MILKCCKIYQVTFKFKCGHSIPDCLRNFRYSLLYNLPHILKNIMNIRRPKWNGALLISSLMFAGGGRSVIFQNAPSLVRLLKIACGQRPRHRMALTSNRGTLSLSVIPKSNGKYARGPKNKNEPFTEDGLRMNGYRL